MSFAVKHFGELSEWLKEHAWKACLRETVTRVRIPHSPPNRNNKYTPTNVVRCIFFHRKTIKLL